MRGSIQEDELQLKNTEDVLVGHRSERQEPCQVRFCMCLHPLYPVYGVWGLELHWTKRHAKPWKLELGWFTAFQSRNSGTFLLTTRACLVALGYFCSSTNGGQVITTFVIVKSYES